MAQHEAVLLSQANTELISVFEKLSLAAHVCGRAEKYELSKSIHSYLDGIQELIGRTKSEQYNEMQGRPHGN